MPAFSRGDQLYGRHLLGGTAVYKTNFYFHQKLFIVFPPNPTDPGNLHHFLFLLLSPKSFCRESG